MPFDPLEALGKIDPEMLKRLREQDEFVYADGALPRKVKLLMAMAFDAAHLGGVGALYTASAGLKEGQ